MHIRCCNAQSIRILSISTHANLHPRKLGYAFGLDFEANLNIKALPPRFVVFVDMW